MGKIILKSKTIVWAASILLLMACASIKDATHTVIYRTYSTMLPSGKLFSVTFSTDSTFEEKSYAGIFKGWCPIGNFDENQYIYCESDLLFNGKTRFLEKTHCLLCEYTFDSIKGSGPQLKIFDRDGSLVKLAYVYFSDSNGNEIHIDNTAFTEEVYCFNIPQNTKQIEVSGENSLSSLGGCKYKQGLGDVNFYTIPQFSRCSYWLKNEDSLYYIPIDVAIDDTARFLLLPRVK